MREPHLFWCPQQPSCFCGLSPNALLVVQKFVGRSECLASTSRICGLTRKFLLAVEEFCGLTPDRPSGSWVARKFLDFGGMARRQKLYVMRHGERLDDADPAWVAIPGVRTWDPPLTARGTEQAIEVGSKLRSEGVEITRILVSPFLRCVQTTAGVIKGLYPQGIDMSNLKVSIEYGLAELMNKYAIRNPPQPGSTEPWHIPFEKLYSVLPSEVVDTSVESIIPKLPEWEESTEDGHKRFSSTFFGVADKFPDENVLCVSHGEGVAVSAMHLRPNVEVYGVQYCAHTLAEREISSSERGPWTLMTQLGTESGLLYRDLEG